jgi:23S rRNA pseudouridine1911/1915/1917 synthase
MKAADFDHTTDESAAGRRLDQHLAERFPEVSRSQWSKRIDDGSVRVDGKASSPSQKLKGGERLTLNEPKRKTFSMSASLDGPAPRILHEDAHCLVLDKPVGLTVHAGSGVRVEQTVAGWLVASGLIDPTAGEFLEEERPGIVHRLDRGTSGLMVVAKNVRALEKLSKQFAERTAERFYWAVVDGRMKSLFQKRPVRLDKLLHRNPAPLALRLQENGVSTFASRLDRDPAERTRFRVSSEGGKRAVTHFLEVSQNERQSVVELKLATGRTHQIRVHLSFLGFPILGDGSYGGRGHPRILLHAHLLRFDHPETGKRLEFNAPWPEANQRWLQAEGLASEHKRDVWEKFLSASPKTWGQAPDHGDEDEVYEFESDAEAEGESESD